MCARKAQEEISRLNELLEEARVENQEEFRELQSSNEVLRQTNKSCQSQILQLKAILRDTEQKEEEAQKQKRQLQTTVDTSLKKVKDLETQLTLSKQTEKQNQETLQKQAAEHAKKTIELSEKQQREIDELKNKLTEVEGQKTENSAHYEVLLSMVAVLLNQNKSLLAALVKLYSHSRLKVSKLLGEPFVKAFNLEPVSEEVALGESMEMVMPSASKPNEDFELEFSKYQEIKELIHSVCENLREPILENHLREKGIEESSEFKQVGLLSSLETELNNGENAVWFLNEELAIDEVAQECKVAVTGALAKIKVTLARVCEKLAQNHLELFNSKLDEFVEDLEYFKKAVRRSGTFGHSTAISTQSLDSQTAQIEMYQARIENLQQFQQQIREW